MTTPTTRPEAIMRPSWPHSSYLVGVPPPQQVSDTLYTLAIVDPQAFVLLVTDADQPNGRVARFTGCSAISRSWVDRHHLTGRDTPSMGTWCKDKCRLVLNGRPMPSIKSMWPFGCHSNKSLRTG